MFTWVDLCGARPAVMGVVNVTPDSFSDGGRFFEPDAAVAHGLALVARAPTCSTSAASRPGPVPSRWPTTEELRRVVPVVEALAAEAAVPVSIDTTQGRGRGGCDRRRRDVVNDVSAGRADPDMLGVVAERRCRLRRDAHAG